MKELSIEEKAKAYDEAIEKIKYVMEHGVQPVLNKEDLQSIFPEIFESEDERIRKAIITFFESEDDNTTYALVPKKDILAWLEKQGDVNALIQEAAEKSYTEGMRVERKRWLEKQGEQPKEATYTHEVETGNGNIKALVTEKVQLPKFKVGDWIVNNQTSTIYLVKSIRDNEYCLWPLDAKIEGFLRIVDFDSEYHFWTIQDAKDGDVLYSLDSKQPFIFKHRKTNEQANVYCGINIYGKFFVGNTKDCIITTDKYIPATKEQRDQLFAKMREAGYSWDEKKKALRKIERKLASSAKNCENDTILNLFKDALLHYRGLY